MKKCEGEYGRRKIIFENDQLYYEITGVLPKSKMIPIAPDYYCFETTDIIRIKFNLNTNSGSEIGDVVASDVLVDWKDASSNPASDRVRCGFQLEFPTTPPDKCRLGSINSSATQDLSFQNSSSKWLGGRACPMA